ncbi:MAG: hypothetical protein AAF957_25600 [Planctomycetota bacterium]
MNYSRMSKEQAEALARRDRNRIIGLTFGAILIGGLYLYSAGNAQEGAEAPGDAPIRPEVVDEESASTFEVIPFDQPDVLAEIKDSTEAEQDFLETEPLREVFGYARLQTAAAFDAMGLRNLDAAVSAELLAAPAEHRLDALLVRGEVLAVAPRAREGSQRSDWMGSIRGEDGTIGHFLVAAAPMQSSGERAIRVGDYLRIDGLFHCVHRRAVDLGEGPTSVSAPLVLGPRAAPSTPELTEEIARLLPTLGSVVDDSVGKIIPEGDFELAQWELMGRASLLGEETDWESVPELDSETLRAIYENGDAYRGKPFKLPVSVNMDTYSVRVDDNPLRLDRMTIGWVGNNNWKGPVKTIKWLGPFTRQDMLRMEQDDQHRYLTGKGYFFRNHVFDNAQSQPIRAPVFVMHSIDVYTPEPEWSVAAFTYGVLGGTVILVGAIFLLLRADRKRSEKLYEDMVRRRRARRERSPEPA